MCKEKSSQSSPPTKREEVKRNRKEKWEKKECSQSEKPSENKDPAPLKKKIKSFASAMSLILKSKKDTSYVENPVKARKTAKKLKRRRGHKKVNQQAKPSDHIKRN